MSWRSLAVSAAAGVVGIGAGYVLGYGRGHALAMGLQVNEVQARMTSDANALCFIRLGDQEGAVRLLETHLDTAAATLPQGRQYAELSPTTQRALAAAKVYRTAYPSQTRNPELDQVLSEVPFPAYRFCAGDCPLDRVAEELRAR
jgi:hypothetical protein